ncbi:amino acid decarboxylase [Pseudomonas sp. PA15(2017)]|nr:amino acid decarboxylase [Pseudomonas sp. PA15(2017)]
MRSHQHPLVAQLLKRHSAELSKLVRGLGSPLHVVLPQIFTENVCRLKKAFTDTGLSGDILFAKKANKADCFARACAQQGIGIDVASSGELGKALAAGVLGKHIGISGPEKPSRLLTEALYHQCLIAIDSVEELVRLTSLANVINCNARILLRRKTSNQANSRFGLDTKALAQALDFCQAHRQALTLEGFSFHLGGYSLEERARCASEAMDLCLQVQKQGIATCRRVNIGGGLPVQYVAPRQWQAFLRQDAPEHYHAAKTFGEFYPYGGLAQSGQSLVDLLACAVDSGVSLADKARRHGIGLIVEPGRALLDQAGMSFFQVLGVKQREAAQDYALVTVQGSSLSLSEQWFNSEFLPDPILLDSDDQAHCQAVFQACIGASTCLECDMLTWRKIGFPRVLRPGDQLVYLNTAGYQMDSNESPFHEAELPKKVVVDLDADLELQWRLDGV